MFAHCIFLHINSLGVVYSEGKTAKINMCMISPQMSIQAYLSVRENWLYRKQHNISLSVHSCLLSQLSQTVRF